MMAGEVSEPKLTIPLSLFIAIPLIIVCYLAVNLAYFAVLPMSILLESDSTAIVMIWLIGKGNVF